jgi:hypothetical protein
MLFIFRRNLSFLFLLDQWLILGTYNTVTHLCQCIQHHQAPLAAEKHKIMEKYCQDRPNQAVLPIKRFVEKLYDQLSQNTLYLSLVSLLITEFWAEHHLAYAFNCDLSEHPIFDKQVVASNQVE